MYIIYTLHIYNKYIYIIYIYIYIYIYCSTKRYKMQYQCSIYIKSICFADKTTKIYKMTVDTHEKLLKENITAVYKKAPPKS